MQLQNRQHRVSLVAYLARGDRGARKLFKPFLVFDILFPTKTDINQYHKYIHIPYIHMVHISPVPEAIPSNLKFNNF